MKNFICPICDTDLKFNTTSYGKIYECEFCLGKMVNLAVLRKNIEKNIVNQFWRQACNAEIITDKRCPSCRQSLKEINARLFDDEIILDICQKCQAIWFDSGELESIPVKRIEPSENIKKTVALAEVKLETERHDFERKAELILDFVRRIIAFGF